MTNKQIYDLIKSIVVEEIKAQGLLIGQWHLGVVNSVVDSKFLSVFIDGSTTAQNIPYNPSVSFIPNEEIWVVYINGNSKDKFALCKRAV
jgi:hypothetical protein